MKTLYVSDLDGTLLRGNERTSGYTNTVINDLTAKGMLFSYATARSYITAAKATAGLDAQIPLIVYNGAFIIDNRTKEILLSNFFTDGDAEIIMQTLQERLIQPITYAFIEGRERFSYRADRLSRGAREFLVGRRGDIRDNPVSDDGQLRCGDKFYFSCIDEEEKLRPAYEKLQDRFRCIFQRDIYSGEPWLEILPRGVSKAHAAMQLKAHLCCDRVVSFGDGINDIEMFEISDECYAVENAAPELKRVATGIIGRNDSDSVAKWLSEHFAAQSE